MKKHFCSCEEHLKNPEALDGVSGLTRLEEIEFELMKLNSLAKDIRSASDLYRSIESMQQDLVNHEEECKRMSVGEAIRRRLYHWIMDH